MTRGLGVVSDIWSMGSSVSVSHGIEIESDSRRTLATSDLRAQRGTHRTTLWQTLCLA